MIEVEITNYESIEHLSFCFDKFCTIVGRNWIGKSAVLRAINAALTNKQGNSFIRWGEKFCEVRIKTKDIHILWHKEEGNNFYLVDDVKYQKIGKDDPPPPIINAGFGLITVGDQKINIGYSKQFYPLFLVNKKDVSTADILVSVYGLDKLYKASEFCNKDLRNTKSLLKIRKSDLEIAKNAFDRYNGFDEIIEQRKNLIVNKKKIEKDEESLNFLKSSHVKLLEAAQICKKLDPISKIEIPDISSTQNDIVSIKQLKRFLEAFFNLNADIKKIENVNNIIIPDCNDVKNTLEDLKKLKKWQERILSLEKEIKVCEEIPRVIFPQIPNDGLKDLASLKEKATKIKNLAEEYKNSQVELEKIKEDIIVLEKERSTYDTCPACGATLK